MEAGQFNIRWDGTDYAGHHVPSGFYRIHVEAGAWLAWNDVFWLANAMTSRVSTCAEMQRVTWTINVVRMGERDDD